MAYSVNQIHELINKIVKDAYGEGSFEVSNNLKGLIALGDKVFSSNTDRELFMNALTNQIGKTVFSNRSYSAKSNNILMENLEYGSMIRKIYVEPIEAKNNPSWDMPEIGGKLDIGSFRPPAAKQSIFESRNTWELEITIPDYQMQTAFTDYAEMSAFLSSIYTQIENSLNIQIESLASTCIANFMAEKFVAEKYMDDTTKKGIQVINLKEEYEKVYPPAPFDPQNPVHYEIDQALSDPLFLKFAGRMIKQTLKRMEHMSTMYNTKGYARFTPKDKLHVLLHTNYVSANATFLESDTFNKDMVALPKYDEVLYWQNFNFPMGINIDTGRTGDAPMVHNILGFAFDHDALGIMVNRRSSTSFYNPKYEVTNKWEKADYGMFNDLSENAVIFYFY